MPNTPTGSCAQLPFDQGAAIQETAPIVESNHQNLCVPQLVAAQAKANPGAVALTMGKVSLSYRELDQRADLLAYHLRSLGVSRDVIVGLYLNRSIAMVVGALAVLRAGGAYLPLDPAYPVERLVFLMSDASIPVLLTGECMASSLLVQPQHVVTLNLEGGSKCCQAGEPITAGPKKDDLAYVIYTSGSTGQPKGVEISHGALLNLVSWHQAAFKVNREDRASHLSAVAFDAAVWEIWPYLTAGASVHLPEFAITHEPEAVRDWLVAQEVTIGFLPTPLAERAMTLEWPSKTKLRIMLTGADTLHHYPPRKLPFRLVNNYGPTECTVVTTSGIVLPTDSHDQLPSIGRAIDGVQVHIFDDARRAVPNGEAGEIYIGGAGLARGYRNRPDLTEQKFIPSPFGPESGSRLYRTGDLGRFLPDGQIAFLGRIDEQIKIRGFRLEPAEIVKVLDEQPDVQASVVVAREVNPGDKQLVAYFIAAPNKQPTHTQLRNFLADRLPAYMVPATFVRLDNLPLNPNGKVDLAALPVPSAENTARDNAFIAPRTPIEERLAPMLADLIGIERVSIDDNFFLIGGHSLLGTQLIAKVRDEFGIELSLRSLFDAPTITKLAEQIESLLLAAVEAMSEEEANRLLGIAAGGEA